MKNDPNMRICLKNKRIYLNRYAIGLIGNPSHLVLHYDERDGILYFSPAEPNNMDAYEIPTHFWSDISKQCTIARIAFLKALQYRHGWENGSKYFYNGTVININNVPTLVYVLADGVRIR